MVKQLSLCVFIAFGCNSGPDEATLVEGTRVMAAMSTIADDALQTEWVIAQTDGSSRMRAWACVDEQRCVASDTTELDASISVRYQTSIPLENLTEPALLLYGLACQTEQSCALHAADVTNTQLAQPQQYLPENKFAEVFLFRSLITPAVFENPLEITLEARPETVADGTRFQLVANQPDVTYRPYSSFGGFEKASVESTDGKAELVWKAPKEGSAEKANIWLVARTMAGSVAVLDFEVAVE